jgi:hypothetical protein
MDHSIDSEIDITTLKPGMVLEVETRNSIYRIEFTETRIVKIVGGMLVNGEDRFATPQEAVILGSVGYEKTCPDCICRNMRLVLLYDLGKSNQVLRTSAVQNVKIEDSHNDWTYDMEWNK